MQKNIATALAVLITVGALIYGSDGKILSVQPSRPGFPQEAFLNLPSLALRLPFISNADIISEAWETFEKYKEAIRAHDLDKVKSLSHQISPTCDDPAKRDECNALMDNVSLLTENWMREDFTQTAYDGRQVVLSTDYIEVSPDLDPIKTVLFFTREPYGEPKVLGIKFCFGIEGLDDECVDTNPATRDSDNNGWWDDVEARFY